MPTNEAPEVPVNVLRVLELAESRGRTLDEEADAKDARAAVADLIQAAQNARTILFGATHPACRRPGDGIEQLDAALARVCGGAA